jgi:hypothetical protein
MNQTQQEFDTADAGNSQEHLLARYLIARPYAWVPMPQLARIITDTGIGTAVHSRVAGARRRFGMDIQQRRGRSAGHSEYRYVPRPVTVQLQLTMAAA